MVAPTIAGSTIECVVRAGDILGETPLWCDRSQKLWWVDIERRLQQSFDPATVGALVTLGLDIGGTGLKASVLDKNGHMIVERVRVATPKRCTPEQMVDALAKLAKPLPAFDRISIGFPGVVRNGRVLTAAHFGHNMWRGFPLQQKLGQRLGKPARLCNDAEVQGLGIIRGRGLEVVLTLGTGVGSAIFAGGRMAPHLELAHHPIHKSDTYNEHLGAAARKKIGNKKWNCRVLRMIGIVETLLNYDTHYLSGGNAGNVKTDKLPENMKTASNDMGIIGGIRLWDDAVWQIARMNAEATLLTPPGRPEPDIGSLET